MSPDIVDAATVRTEDGRRRSRGIPLSVTDVLVVAGDAAAAAGVGGWFFGPKPTSQAAVADE